MKTHLAIRCVFYDKTTGNKKIGVTVFLISTRQKYGFYTLIIHN